MPDTYRGWDIEFVHPPIPTRLFDWCATEPNSDGQISVYGVTRADCEAEVDEYIEENE